METQPAVNPEINARRRRELITICLLVLGGYILTQLATLAAKFLGLTSMTLPMMCALAAGVILGTIFFILVIAVKKNITPQFAIIIFFGQYVLYLFLYPVWVFHLNEIRVFGLICALIALTFVLLNSNVVQSLLISMGTIVIQTGVSSYAILYAGQKGSLAQELFYIATFLPSYIVISMVARRITSQKNILRLANAALREINRDLTAANTELVKEREINNFEIELATNVQGSLLPRQAPQTELWDIAYEFKPYTSISGDFFDFYMEQETFEGLCLFDVTGHGVAAGLITTLAKPVIFQLFRRYRQQPVGTILDEANRRLITVLEKNSLLITGIVMRFNNTVVEYVNAGHPDCIIKDGDTGDVSTITSLVGAIKNYPLGIKDDAYYTARQVSVKRNDLFLVYSDCILESCNPDRTSFGKQRLIDAFRRAPDGSAQEILNSIMDDFYAFVGTARLKDDLTVIVAKRTG